LLTDNEIKALLADDAKDDIEMHEFTRAIEQSIMAKLREQAPVKTSAHHSAVRKVLQHFDIPLDGVLEADLIYAVLGASNPAPIPG
jgi:Ca2+-binding EF-hand superfamily protein